MEHWQETAINFTIPSIFIRTCYRGNNTLEYSKYNCNLQRGPVYPFIIFIIIHLPFMAAEVGLVSEARV
jgi:hypothetical protein